jgi:zinc/manganese transport system ATP-binding protein
MILRIEKGLTIGYKRRTVAIVREALEFRDGEVTLMLGLNGQGKTTFMKTLTGLVPPVTGKISRTRSLYLSDEIDLPENLTPLEILRALDPESGFRQLGRELLNDLEVPEKKYGTLSKGNRQKARIVFAEIVSAASRVKLVALDEPFLGLDFQAREYLVGRWLAARNRWRHLLVSLHPSEIPVAPNQILLVSRGEIFSVPSSMAWSEIRHFLQESAAAAA